MKPFLLFVVLLTVANAQNYTDATLRPTESPVGGPPTMRTPVVNEEESSGEPGRGIVVASVVFVMIILTGIGVYVVSVREERRDKFEKVDMENSGGVW
jgi:hypothetical protein